jgi:hypothetical protein
MPSKPGCHELGVYCFGYGHREWVVIRASSVGLAALVFSKHYPGVLIEYAVLPTSHSQPWKSWKANGNHLVNMHDAFK